jgi:hypothetical protein
MDVWIGTSGYSYPDWVGEFYPPGPRPERMLGHYSQFFPLVELNFTFYRPPTAGLLLRLADKAPAEFQFLVKLPQTASHQQSAADLPGFRKAAEALDRRHQLAGPLCQLPQSTHNTRRAAAWLTTLGRELADLRLGQPRNSFTCRASRQGARGRGQLAPAARLDIPLPWETILSTPKMLFEPSPPAGGRARRRLRRASPTGKGPSAARRLPVLGTNLPGGLPGTKVA